MKKRPITIRYLFFYILFLPDTWRAMMGLAAAYGTAPLIELPQGGAGGNIMKFFMIAVIGYAVTAVPARWITRILIKWILGEKQA